MGALKEVACETRGQSISTMAFLAKALTSLKGISHWLRGLAIAIVIAAGTSGQSSITYRYFYDDLNQLVKVTDSTGATIQYVYDASGNLLQVLRSVTTPGALTIFNISPATVGAGGTLVIQGQGFNVAASSNQVLINGIAATVISATATTLTVSVPFNAKSGIVSVTVGGTTVTYSAAETVIPLPVITSLSPKSSLAGTALTLTVTGANFTGAAFSFASQTGASLGVPTVSAGGTSATMTVTLTAAAQGRFTLLATNSAGSSDTTPTLGFTSGHGPFNTLTVPGVQGTADPDQDGLTNAQELAAGTDPLNGDTDGDTYVDGLEALLGSDPLNPASIPTVHRSGYLSSPVMSILNSVTPGSSAGIRKYVSGSVISVLNTLNPGTAVSAHQYFVSPTFSVLNCLPRILAVFNSRLDGTPVTITNSLL